jgi:hypothetical protein
MLNRTRPHLLMGCGEPLRGTLHRFRELIPSLQLPAAGRCRARLLNEVRSRR